MKKLQQLILMMVAIAALFACNSNHPEGEIKLNNGEKWVVNSEMKPHIVKGNEILNEFISKQDKDYHTLAENLTAQNNALIQSCNMKGESHDELHKWLLPHMELIDNLSKANNIEEAENIISELEESFKTFHNHFQ